MNEYSQILKFSRKTSLNDTISLKSDFSKIRRPKYLPPFGFVRGDEAFI